MTLVEVACKVYLLHWSIVLRCVCSDSRFLYTGTLLAFVKWIGGGGIGVAYFFSLRELWAGCGSFYSDM